MAEGTLSFVPAVAEWLPLVWFHLAGRPKKAMSHSATPDRKFHVGSIWLQSPLVRGRGFALAASAMPATGFPV